MATQANSALRHSSEDGFFRVSAIAMALVIVAGFSLQVAMGRSSFSAPPLVHAHALVFMGWVGIYVAQAMTATSGNRALHRRLGWLAAVWVVPMLVLGLLVTLALVRGGRVPFFFTPLQFLIFDPLSVVAFAGLTAAAIVRRRQTDWHRRLHFCAMTLLLGPGIGRLIPAPLLIPFVFETVTVLTLLFPAAGVISDFRRTGSVHPAWAWGIGTIIIFAIAIEVITNSSAGAAVYAAATAGTPGAAVAPLAFPPMPG